MIDPRREEVMILVIEEASVTRGYFLFYFYQIDPHQILLLIIKTLSFIIKINNNKINFYC